MKCSYGNRSYSTVDVERASHSSVHPINKSRNVCSLVYCKILNLLLLWILCVPCFLELCLGETSGPMNRAAAKGDGIQLNCSTKEPYDGHWKYTKPFEKNDREIYNGVKVVNGMTTIFSVVNNSVHGRFNVLFNAYESTSGRYTCLPDLNTVDQSAEVIVLDTSPNCSMIVTSDVVNASCTINFSGNWAPKIQWHDLNGRIETNDTTTVQNSRVTSFLIVPVNQTDNLTCTPTFSLENKPQETTATNVPVLHTNCTLILGLSSDDSSTRPTTTNGTTPSPPRYIIGILAVFASVIIIALLVVVPRYMWRQHRMCYINDPPEETPTPFKAKTTRMQNDVLLPCTTLEDKNTSSRTLPSSSSSILLKFDNDSIIL